MQSGLRNQWLKALRRRSNTALIWQRGGMLTVNTSGAHSVLLHIADSCLLLTPYAKCKVNQDREKVPKGQTVGQTNTSSCLRCSVLCVLVSCTSYHHHVSTGSAALSRGFRSLWEITSCLENMDEIPGSNLNSWYKPLYVASSQSPLTRTYTDTGPWAM